MNIRRLLRIIGIPLIVLTPMVLVCGQAPPKAAPRDKPCHEDTRLCAVRINKNYSALAAYVKHLKPGTKLVFNPQPDPPGDPGPAYRTAMAAYQKLQYDLYDLSKYPPGPCNDGACREAIDHANSQFGMLGNSSDQRSANSAIGRLKFDIERLSRSLASMRQAK